MSLFAPKYLAAQPFELTHVPGLDQRVEYLRQWQARIRSGRVHKSKEEALQADFLNLIFGEALGYDYQDAHLWHLEKEQKSACTPSTASPRPKSRWSKAGRSGLFEGRGPGRTGAATATSSRAPGAAAARPPRPAPPRCPPPRPGGWEPLPELRRPAGP